MIKHIILEIDGKEIKVSIESAKKLQYDLNVLFDKPIIPLPFEYDKVDFPKYPVITCGN